MPPVGFGGGASNAETRRVEAKIAANTAAGRAPARIELAVGGGFDREKENVLEASRHRRLDPVGLQRRHAAERLQAQHEMREAACRVINRLADFQVSLAAPGEAVVVGVCQACDFALVRQPMRNRSQPAADPVVAGAVNRVSRCQKGSAGRMADVFRPPGPHAGMQGAAVARTDAASRFG
jgi:hypothetical protein